MTTLDQTTDVPRSWREFAGQLPAHVIRRFERNERLTELHGPLAFPQEDPAEVIRKDQQMMFEEARNQIPFARVPLPTTATDADLWDDDGEGNWSRVVEGTSRSTGPLSVNIIGVQSADGSMRWAVSVDTKDHEVSSVQLRDYAVLLTDAADEVDELQQAGR